MEPATFTAGLLISWKYLALFPLLIVEGFIVTLAAGFLVSNHTLLFYPTLLIVVAGDICSDMFYYWLAYRGSRLLSSRWAKLIGLKPARVQQIEKLYRHHGGTVLIAAKLTNALALAAVVAAGFIKMPFRRFLAFCTAAAVPKALILLLIGYYFGNAYGDVSHVLESAFIIVTLIILLILGGWYLQKRLLGTSR